MTEPRTRHSRGLIVIIALGVIFFTLLGLIVLKSGKDRPRQVARAETVSVLPEQMRVRTEPNARAAVVATAVRGEKLQLVEDHGAWVLVKTGDGLTGWAERAHLERTAEQARRLARYANIRRMPPLKGSVRARAPLYGGPGIFYPVVGELREGADITVFTRDHDFYAIDHGGSVAYADVDSIDVLATGTRELLVQTSTADVAEEGTTTAPPQTASLPPVDTPPVFEPEPEPEPVREPEPVESTVYSAVPPGGTQPVELDRAVPRYPAVARAAGVEGAVVVRGIVRRDGTIDDVEVIKDLPYGLGESARSAVRRWRFRPATYRGRPIDVYYTVTVNFRLQ